MKTIKILGTGCPSCNTTEKVVEEVVRELNLDVKVIEVSDIQEIMKYDVLSTPAVVIDEKVVIKGRVPSKDEIKELLLNKDTCCEPKDDSSSEEKTSKCC
ncbi:thioredoxin family protein [Lutibacter sp.]